MCNTVYCDILETVTILFIAQAFNRIKKKIRPCTAQNLLILNYWRQQMSFWIISTSPGTMIRCILHIINSISLQYMTNVLIIIIIYPAIIIVIIMTSKSFLRTAEIYVNIINYNPLVSHMQHFTCNPEHISLFKSGHMGPAALQPSRYEHGKQNSNIVQNSATYS